MRKRTEKLLAAILCLLMTVTLLPAASFAEEPSGDTAPATTLDPVETEQPEKEEIVPVDLTLAEPQPKREDTDAAGRGTVYSDSDLTLGITSYTIPAGDIVYRKFTAPSSGTYWFCSMGDADTLGYMQNAEHTLILTSDDEGFGQNYMLGVSLEPDARSASAFSFTAAALPEPARSLRSSIPSTTHG